MNTSSQQALNPVDVGSFVMPSRMPKEVRNDPEVAAKLQELEQAAKAYMSFDMQKLQSDMNRELEKDIHRLNQEYINHQQEVQSKLQ